LHDAAVLVLSFYRALAFRQFMRQRLFDIYIFARSTSIDGNWHVPVIGRADQYRIDIFAIQQAAIVLSGESARLSQLGALSKVKVPHIANRDDLHARNRRQRLHQSSAAASGANASDGDRVVRGEAFGSGRVSGSDAASCGNAKRFEQLSAGD